MEKLLRRLLVEVISKLKKNYASLKVRESSVKGARLNWQRIYNQHKDIYSCIIYIGFSCDTIRKKPVLIDCICSI